MYKQHSWFAFVALAMVLFSSIESRAAEPTANSRDVVLNTPGLIRLYTFDKTKDTGSPIESLVVPGAPLKFSTAGKGEPEKNLTTVPGRLAALQAVRLDRAVYSAPTFPVENSTFSVEAWIKIHGPGAIKGDAPEQTGTLLSEGDGYIKGWRILLSYPTRTLHLELGHPPHAFDISATTPILDDVWHHLAVTWDGHHAAMYLDGLMIASADYDGAYTPPAAGTVFRLGYAGAGWGSIAADFDEVAVYRRALGSTEILRHALAPTPLSDSAAAAFDAGDRELAENDLPGALKSYRAILDDAKLNPNCQAAVHLRLARALRQQGHFTEAIAEYCTVARMPNVPEGLMSLAVAPVLDTAVNSGGVPREMLEFLLNRPENLTPEQKARLQMNQGRALAAEGNTAEAVKAYEAALTQLDLSSHDRLEALLQLGHAHAGAGQFAAARDAYAKVSNDAAAPASARAHALLCAARTCQAEKQFADAEKLLRQVVEIGDVPEIYRWEAADSLAQVQRLSQGLPARDPTASRTSLPAAPAPGAELYVSPKGDDANSGSIQQPLATLAGAQTAVRAIIKKGLPAGGVVVHIAPGEYRLRESLHFGPADSGTPQSPVIWRGEPSGKAILTGGTKLTGWQLVTDPAIFARLPEEARGKVFQTDLKAQGITEFSPLRPRGFVHGGARPPVLELFCGDQPLTLSRWPNEGFERVKSVVSNDDHGAVFEYAGDRPSRWKAASDAWMYGYWKWQWADSQDPLTAIDTAARTIRMPKAGYSGIKADAPYFVFNLLEEIDRPGEWYVDRAAGIAYLYPTADLQKSPISVSLLPVPLIAGNDVSWLHFEGLTLQLGQTIGIRLEGGQHCLIAGCTIHNLGGDAIVISGGHDQGILSCDLYNLGRGGCVVTGGNRKTLESSGDFLENCQVHHYSRIDHVYTPAVLLDGCGTRVAHNSFHHSPCQGFRIEGNDHLIEFNDVFEVAREIDDNGGVDMFLNPSYRGVVIRYNSWHDIGTPYPTLIGQAGVRLDDAISGVQIYGNLFRACSTGLFGGVQLHGGKDDVVVNNFFIDCKYAISFSPWGEKKWKKFLDGAELQKLLHHDVEIDQPPYSTKYPALAHLYEHEGTHQVWDNLVINCGAFLTRDRGLQNLLDNQVLFITAPSAAMASEASVSEPNQPANSGLRCGGFRPIPVSEIGLYPDAWRAGR